MEYEGIAACQIKLGKYFRNGNKKVEVAKCVAKLRNNKIGGRDGLLANCLNMVHRE